jgi:anti-anti-sigma factor
VEDASIMVSAGRETGFVRVLGKGSFKNARYVKCFIDKLIETGLERFVIDLQECTHMDSTFMGTLAGISSKLRAQDSPPPTVVNISPRNLELLQNLGLDRVLKISSDPASIQSGGFAPAQADAPDHKEAIAEAMLDAHEALVEVDERNAQKFQDVISYLRDKLGVPNV